MAQKKIHQLPSEVTQNLMEILFSSDEGRRQIKTIVELLGLKGNVDIQASIALIHTTPDKIEPDKESEKPEEVEKPEKV